MSDKEYVAGLPLPEAQKVAGLEIPPHLLPQVREREVRKQYASTAHPVEMEPVDPVGMGNWLKEQTAYLRNAAQPVKALDYDPHANSKMYLPDESLTRLERQMRYELQK